MSALNRNLKTEFPPADSSHSNESPRRNPFLVVWQRRWTIVICLVLAMGGALAYLYFATPKYEAVAKVQVEQNTPHIIATDVTGAGMSGVQDYLWAQCTLLDSRDFLAEVADEPGIRDLKSFQPLGTDVVNRLRLMVNPSVGRRDNLISIAVQSIYAEDTAQIANAVVMAYIKHNDSAKRSLAREILDILQNRQVKIDQQLDEGRKKLLDFKTKNANFSFSSDHIAPTLDRMARLSQALTEMQLNTLNAQASYDTAKAMSDDPVKARELLESRALKSETAEMQAKLRDLQQELVGMSNRYLPGFPELTGIQAAIKQLRQDMDDEDHKIIAAYLAELDAQVQADKRADDQIQSLLDQQRAEVIQYNSLVAQYADLQGEVDSLQKSEDELNDRIRQLSLTEDAGALNVTTVESAIVSKDPVSPKVWQTLLGGLLVGGMAGTGLAFLRDWMDQRLRSIEEIKQVLALPVLGIVPHITEAPTAAQRGKHLHLEPMSDVAEAYRTIRTAVYFGQPGGAAKTLLITSPSPSEGKTTLASNLAIAMAQAGNRILLLDADFRRPTQHKMFEIDKKIGLSNVLAGTAQLRDVIVHSPVPGLDILPCGPIPANPSEILNSQTFADLLEELSQEYDHVLLDSPPVVPVTDARILAASCDATVLAIRAEKTTRKSALHARDMLRSVGSHLLGVVVNDVPRRKGIYGYYYTYGDAYQYGYGPRRIAGPAAGAAKENGNGASAASSTAAKH